MRLINWLMCQLAFIKFRVRHPMVPIIKPLLVGTYYSQDGQDLYLAALLFNVFKSKEKQYVVDIGCNHPERFSNSKFFEQYFNCKTIAIDPIEEYGTLWHELRPDALFIPTALGETDGSVTLSIPNGSVAYDDMFSFTAGRNPKIGSTECTQRNVPCVTLASILAAQQVSSVIVLSIDVEGAEMGVLQGIDFEQVEIQCLIIENNTDGLFGTEEIRLYLVNKGYVFFARIGFLDDVFIHHSLANKLPKHRSFIMRVAILLGLQPNHIR